MLSINLDIGDVVLENRWDIDLNTAIISIVDLPMNVAPELGRRADTHPMVARCRRARAMRLWLMWSLTSGKVPFENTLWTHQYGIHVCSNI